MSLWVDKYRPRQLSQLDYHHDLSTQLENLASSSDFPHLLVYGPSGAGKKTRIMCALRALYGPGVEKIKIDQRLFTTASGKKLELNIVSSNYHIEMNPADVGIHDRVVIQDMIKEIAQTQQVDASASKKFKVVVLNEADSLSRDAQAALRRTMEKYMSNMRVILCCNSTSKIISPIRSRCLLVRVAAPSCEDISSVLQKVCHKESLKLPSTTATAIAQKSERNLRRALLMLEAARVQKYPFDENPDSIPTTDWEDYVRETALEILKEQTPQKLLAIRNRLYELMTHCIPPDVILKYLTIELTKNIDEAMKPTIAKEAAFYEHRLRIGSKAIFHLEAFVAKVMNLYKKYLMEMSAGF